MHRLALVALVFAGCADPCSEGQTECVDDHTIRRCIGKRDGWSVDHEWGEPQACFTHNPYCVTRDDIRPDVTPQEMGLCASAQVKSCTGGSFCKAGIRYDCIDGYAVVDLICTNGCAATGNDCAP